MMKAGITLAVLSGLLLACDGSTGPGSGGNVAIRFSSAKGAGISANRAISPGSISADELTVTGTNGNIVIQDIRFIVEEMELRSSESTSTCSDDNENQSGRDDNLVVRTDDRSGSNRDSAETEGECEVEGGPFIVDLALGGNTTVATDNVPPGTYDAFKFKIDDLEGDDQDEADDRTRTPSLLTEMRTAYPDFPSRASMVVKGTQNGQPFTVYFRSKLKIRQTISPPLVIPGDKVLTVSIDPSAWFKSGNQVLNLAALNGRLVDLGDQFESGLEGTRRGDR